MVQVLTMIVEPVATSPSTRRGCTGRATPSVGAVSWVGRPWPGRHAERREVVGRDLPPVVRKDPEAANDRAILTDQAPIAECPGLVFRIDFADRPGASVRGYHTKRQVVHPIPPDRRLPGSSPALMVSEKQKHTGCHQITPRPSGSRRRSALGCTRIGARNIKRAAAVSCRRAIRSPTVRRALVDYSSCAGEHIRSSGARVATVHPKAHLASWWY